MTDKALDAEIVNESQALRTRPGAGAVAPLHAGHGISLGQAWEAVRSGEMSADRLAVMKDLLSMGAERQYAIALGQLQRECQNVVATKDVDGKFRYAPFLDIWNAVRPAVERNHFTLQWSQDHLGDKIKVVLTLQETEGGHKRDFQYIMRLGTNAPGTPVGAQAPVLDSQAESRAKRRLLMDALNIVVDAVTPAEDVGDGTLATEEETDELFKRLVALEPDDAKRATSERRFLALAGVDRWNQIQKLALPILQRLIIEKERAAARKGATA